MLILTIARSTLRKYHMRSVREVKFALPSLFYSLLMGLMTLVHHLHSGLVLHPNGGGLHVVLNELVLIPLTFISMYFYLKNGNRLALFIYLLIAVLGFIFLGLYEGGWNHTVKLISYMRIDSPSTQLKDILPPNNWHYWFYEITGIFTFVFAMIASWYSALFYVNAKGVIRGR